MKTLLLLSLVSLLSLPMFGACRLQRVSNDSVSFDQCQCNSTEHGYESVSNCRRCGVRNTGGTIAGENYCGGVEATISQAAIANPAEFINMIDSLLHEQTSTNDSNDGLHNEISGGKVSSGELGALSKSNR